MGIQQKIDGINKLGYQLTIDVDDQGYIIAWLFNRPDVQGMCSTVLEPANETGNDLDEVLSELTKRLNKTIKEQGNEGCNRK